jgi:hypothetical protein
MTKMSEDIPGTAGIGLPPDIVQPFLLRFRREDLHIMAFFTGHPDYEAVEAMIRYRGDGTPAIRAILTRHDQRQIDHVNDDSLSVEGHGVDRETCRRDMTLAVDAPPGLRHARLEFVSHADEPVVLDITTVGEPDTARGGISDPGTHSPNSSLPLMRRRASTLAGPQTWVGIGGQKFETPVKIRSGPFVAHEGYFTEGHTFGAIRAGTLRYRVKTRPAHAAVGEQWIFESDERRMVYRIASRDADGRLSIVSDDLPAETIDAVSTAGRLRLTRIQKLAVARSEGCLDLSFTAAGHFGLAMLDEAIVTGSADSGQQGTDTIVTLSPTEPAWAVPRKVRLNCSRSGDLVTVVTTIGGN